MRRGWNATYGALAGAATTAVVLHLRNRDRRPPEAEPTAQPGVEEARQRAEANLEAGSAVLHLLFTMKNWVHRRVESVEFRDDTTHVGRVSIDLQVPPHAPRRILDDGRVMRLLPLTALSKQHRLKNFDIRDENGASLSLLTTIERTGLLTSGLRELATVSAGRELDPSLVADLRTMIVEEQEEAEWIFSRWRNAEPGTLRHDLAHDHPFKSVLKRLIRNTVAIVSLDDLPELQRVIKYTYEEPFKYTRSTHLDPRSWVEEEPQHPTWDWSEADDQEAWRAEEPAISRLGLQRGALVALGWAPRVAYLNAPAVEDARSYHLEVTAPSGVEINGAALIVTSDERRSRPDTAASQIDIDRSGESRVHMLFRNPTGAGSRGRAMVLLLPDRREVLLALYAALLIAVVMLAGCFWVAVGLPRAAQQGQGSGSIEQRAAVATLLLVLPAILATLLVKPTEHAMAQHLMNATRLQLIASGVLLYLAAGALVVGPPGTRLTQTWMVLTGLAWVVPLAAVVGAVMRQRGASQLLDAVERAHREKEPLLRLRQVSRRFGSVQALRSVRLDVRSGEVLALVGDNGAGKSTLIKIMAGDLLVDEGEVLFQGRPMPLNGRRSPAQNGIVAVHQDLGLANNLDVVGNLYLGQEELGSGHLLDEHGMEQKADGMVVSLGDRFPHLRVQVGSLSGGQRQSVAIARTGVGEPKVVLLDEPTSALGIRQTDLLLERVRAFRERRLAVVIATHNLESVFAVADRIAILRRGRLVDICDTSNTSKQEIVRAMTGAPPTA
jgi:D-xylose transport system ATP-binding protein